MTDFEVIGKIEHIETMAQGKGIRELKRLSKAYGRGRWFKRKGIAWVRLPGLEPRRAEIHWYEAHGIGKRDLKVKRFLREER